MFDFTKSNNTPKPRKYLFIDGNYFQNTIKNLSKRITETDEIINIDYEILGSEFDRIIYYDSLPVKKKNQSEKDYLKSYEEKETFLNNLRLLPKYHVRDGYTRMRPKAIGGLEQKGVDTWLAIEVLRYSFRNIIDIAEIITGDLDLYPLFEALLQTNTTGVLHYEKGSTSPELIMSADTAIPITTIKLLSWSENNFKKKYNVDTNNSKKFNSNIFEDTYNTRYGECSAQYNDIEWKIKFQNIGNSFVSKNRLLLIDTVNHFLQKEILSDTAFKL